MLSTRLILASAFLLAALQITAQEVPAPEHTPVQLTVSGRSSTLKSIVVADVGQSIPTTFSGDRLKNAAGFSWFVSRHYALQTDYDEAKAKLLLTLLELAYPHYVELFGREPAGLDTKRMAVIYGSKKEILKTVLNADGIDWDFGGGGITYESGINASYNYPSGSLQYHQRYIMLHECTHLFQDCLFGTVMTTPNWFYEGIADALSHHVWEAGAQRLTLNVVDKPTINNWYDAAFAAYAKEPFKASDILTGKRAGRKYGFLLVKYFDTDLDRLMRLRIWRDELIRLALHDKQTEASLKLMDQLFGLAKLDADFDAWIKSHKSSFHYVDWGWEQDGDAMMSYGWPQSGAFSQTDLEFLPKDKPAYDPLVMDYPMQPRSPLVDPVARGVAEPTVGCLIDFRENPDSGVAGMALGVDGRKFLKVLIRQRKDLDLDGTDLGCAQRSIDLTDAFRDASSRNYQIGLTIRIGRDSVEVTARAVDGGNRQSVSLSLPISVEARERLLSKPMAVLSRDGKHWVTPYVDDARKPEPVWGTSTPANRWRFELESELYPLDRAAWHLGKASPPSLLALEKKLIASASDGRTAQDNAKESYAVDLKKVVADIKVCSASAADKQAALDELNADKS